MPPGSLSHTPAVDLFAGGGEMGRRMQAYDWSQHPLGPPERWPQSLRTIVRIMLTSRFAMWLGWGPEFYFFCNDAYLPTLGIKQNTLGAPASKVWAEIWDVVKARAESAVATGVATWDEGLMLLLERSGYPEETYHTFSYSPAPNDDGGNGGMFCVVTEETERFIGQRRTTLLRELATELTKAHSEDETYAAVQRAFAGRPADLPFALFYRFTPETGGAQLEVAHGIEPGHALAPRQLTAADVNSPWPHRELRERLTSQFIDLTGRAAEVPLGPWDRPAREAKILPVTLPGQTQPAGFLVVGLNPYRRVSEAYIGFLDLIVGQIAAALAGAHAYDAERKRATALAEIDRAKTEFFSNVSHEFRTPLTLMLAPLEDELRERTGDRERLETAHRNSLRLLKLVNTLLDFSRLEAGRLRANFQPIDLGRFTAELASSFESLMARANLRFTIDCPPLPAPVHVDREMWEKIVFNLLSNAFKFTLEGEVAVSMRQRGDFVDLIVRDTGTGIPATELPRLFERFHRVHGAKSRSNEGTGIGLALASQLAQLHGGEIAVKSIEGQGTTFTVTVRTGTKHLAPEQLGAPAANGSVPPLGAAAYVEEAARWLPDKATAPALEAPKPASSGPRPRLLLADDNSDMRDYLNRLLAPMYEVQAVGDGEAALAAARAHPPDLVVTDVMMPRLDGFGLLRELRADETLRTIPVLVLSARAGEEAAIEGYAHAADDYLVKPFSARELLARVRTHLDLARIRREAAERVRESEARFQHVADHSPLMFWVTGPDGQCTYLNERWYEYTGQEQAAALGFGWLDAVHPEDRTAAKKAFETANANHAPFRAEYRLRRHDGAYRWMVDAAAPRFIKGKFAGYVGSVLDITDEREELEEIARSRSQLQLALEAGRTGAFDWDMPSGRIAWSPELEKLYGLPVGSFGKTYRAWTEHVLPEDVQAVEAIIQRCLAERREEAAYEFRAILPDGTRRWMEGKAKFFFTPAGLPRRMVGINVDIDERKRTEQNTAFLDRLTQQVTLSGDPDQIIATTVKAVGEYLGTDRCYFCDWDTALTTAHVLTEWQRIPAPTMIGRHRLSDFGPRGWWEKLATRSLAMSDVEQQELAQLFLPAYRSLNVRGYATGRLPIETGYVTLVVSTETPRTWRDDEIALLENVAARIWPLAERARAAQAVAAAERKIRESEERLRTAIEAGQLGTWGIDPLTGEVYWDARSKALFGFGDETVDYHAVLARLHPDDRERVEKAVKAALDPAGNGRYEEEYRVLNPSEDGLVRWLRASARAAFEDGRATRFSGTLLDITPLVQARETAAERRAELERLVAERTAKLQETIAELEGFSYSISHDLRAPLRAMQSFAQILSEEAGEQLTGDSRDYLRRIINASNRMDRLIHDVLNYSQLARAELVLTPIDLQKLVEGIVETYPQFQSTAIDLIVERNLPKVLGNEAALTQCIANLLGNAVKFNRPEVRPVVRVHASTVGDRVRLCVTDNGIGIAAESVHKIFGIFERLSRNYEGTGIGLAVVRKAAERMGGTISVESTPGEGSTFCLELARAP